jgi:hypothetical protein
MLDVIAARLLDWYSIVLLLSIVGSILSLAKLMQQEQRNAGVQEWSKTSEGKFSFLILFISGSSLYGKVLGLSGRNYNLDPLPLPLLLGSFTFLVLLFACATMISRWIDFGIEEQ